MMLNLHGAFDPAKMVQAMRDELTDHGFTELRTSAEVEAALAETSGTTLLVFNSVCGCAAGGARPGVVLSLAGDGPRPDRLLTCFAGQDQEATAQARSHLAGHQPSSPSVYLLADGQVAAVLHRHNIEGRQAEDIATDLQAAYQAHC